MSTSDGLRWEEIQRLVELCSPGRIWALKNIASCRTAMMQACLLDDERALIPAVVPPPFGSLGKTEEDLHVELAKHKAEETARAGDAQRRALELLFSKAKADPTFKWLEGNPDYREAWEAINNSTSIKFPLDQWSKLDFARVAAIVLALSRHEKAPKWPNREALVRAVGLIESLEKLNLQDLWYLHPGLSTTNALARSLPLARNELEDLLAHPRRIRRKDTGVANYKLVVLIVSQLIPVFGGVPPSCVLGLMSMSGRTNLNLPSVARWVDEAAVHYATQKESSKARVFLS